MLKENGEQNEKKNRNRDWTLDFLKGCSIVLVIMLHNSVHLNPDGIVDSLCMLLVQIAVPCFFVVSGALFFQGEFSWKKYGRRLIRFYVVYVVWKLLYLLFYHTQGAPWPGERMLVSYLFLFQSLPGVTAAHFWFMEAMLTVLLIAPMLYNCWKTNRTVFYYITAVLFFFENGLCAGNLILRVVTGLLGMELFEISDIAAVNPLHFGYSFCILYYMMGGILYENRERVSRKRSLWMIGAGYLGLFVVRYIQYGCVQWKGLMISSGYFWISTLVMTSGVFLLVSSSRECRWKAAHVFSKTIGQSTEGIFYLHMPLLCLFDRSLFPYAASWDCWAVNAAEAVLVAAAAFLIVRVLRRIPVLRLLV